MRGILYRTDDEGNPLPKPEVKVSAIRGNNIKVYKTQEAKQEALANGDIKPGDVVLSGGEQYGSGCNPVWSEAVEIPIASVNGYVCPSDGFIVGVFVAVVNTTALLYVNGVYVARSVGGPSIDIDPSIMITVNAGDEITHTGTLYAGDAYSKLTFVPRR